MLVWYEFPELADRATLYALVTRERLSAREIAERVGCTRDQVFAAYRRHGITFPLVVEKER